MAGYPHMRWHAFLPLPTPANRNGCSFGHFVSFLLLCFSSFLLRSFFIFDHHETVNDSSGYDCRLQSVQNRKWLPVDLSQMKRWLKYNEERWNKNWTKSEPEMTSTWQKWKQPLQIAAYLKTNQKIKSQIIECSAVCRDGQVVRFIYLNKVR